MDDKEFKVGLIQIARNIAEAAPDHLQLIERDGAHCLLLNGEPLGRDLELYGFMGRVMGQERALTYVLEEVAYMTKHIPAAYKAATDGLKAIGAKIYTEERQREWEGLF